MFSWDDTVVFCDFLSLCAMIFSAIAHGWQKTDWTIVLCVVLGSIMMLANLLIQMTGVVFKSHIIT